MPATLLGVFQPNGPQVQIGIGLPVVGPVGGTVQTQPITCIIDTAAQWTAISPAVLQALHFPVAGNRRINRPGMVGVPVDTYRVSIWSQAGDLIAGNVEVSGIHPVGTQSLLGQDVLVAGVLVQDGPNQTVRVDFP
jgi:hypothetical protein